ncbi:MAG: SHOCT domain-containing protein [Candidatus Latescibacterota bacterium]
MPGWEYMRSSWWGGMLLTILTVITLILLLLLAIMLLRCFTAKRNDAPLPETPQDILRKRYARGEITAEEYEHMKHFLDG